MVALRCVYASRISLALRSRSSRIECRLCCGIGAAASRIRVIRSSRLETARQNDNVRFDRKQKPFRPYIHACTYMCAYYFVSRERSSRHSSLGTLPRSALIIAYKVIIRPKCIELREIGEKLLLREQCARARSTSDFRRAHDVTSVPKSAARITGDNSPVTSPRREFPSSPPSLLPPLLSPRGYGNLNGTGGIRKYISYSFVRCPDSGHTISTSHLPH